jgi:hypothetical protein
MVVVVRSLLSLSSANCYKSVLNALNCITLVLTIS